MKRLLRTVICTILTAALLVPLTAVSSSAAKLKISKTSADVPVGYSVTVKVTGATSSVKWSSSDESVAAVTANGASAKITGKKTGSATISAKVGSATLKCEVAVKMSVITPSTETVTVSKGKTKTITVKVSGSKDITISNSSKDVCSASWGKWDGNTIKLTIKGKAEGNASIKIYTKNYLKSTAQKINVTVEPKSAEDALIDDVVDIVNKERKKAGKDALKSDDTLNEIAALRAKEIAEKFDHTRPDGTVCFTAFSEAGYVYVSAGENIGYEYNGTAESIMKEWMKSKDHKKNILDGDNKGFTKIGVGHYEVDGKHYWVQVFSD